MNTMSTRTFIPFDPDAHAASGVVVSAPPAGETMLSQVIDAADWHGSGNDECGMTNAECLKGVAKPLNNHQKWKLSELAESVYVYLKRRGELAGETLDGFRRRVAIAACGQRISHASHGDYRAIQAAFIDLQQGLEVKRQQLTDREATALAIAKHKLWELCAKTHTPRQAAETIARRFYKGVGVEQLTTARQVWGVFYTVQNNASAAAGHGSAANRFKSKRRKSA